ncbi:pilus assembly protein [Massilia sp. IC2-477]|uniref:TadE/TadG family type IV pilus assembly protein n=1 Tax=Massilia sp. IC2-477 TaxID=2887198 RepID=UPI001D11EE4C|nr:TadE family protein [Massilia sp. IC2-477]MCC2955251.1 pilus assembly protein [Massilia sp. IC2-477]
MWAADPARRKRRQGGTSAIEFALLAAVFFTLVFGVIELARLMYVFNTLQEVTRRAAEAAAHVYPDDADGLARVRQYAVFRDSPGGLILAPPVTDGHIRLSYLNYDLNAIPSGSRPASALLNREICMTNPYAVNCIRFVQAQVCRPDVEGDCEAPTSQMLIPLIDLRIPLHRATTIVTAESLGYVPGGLPCPCP